VQLFERLLGHEPDSGVYCVVRFPDSVESRRFEKLPTPGTRLRSNGGHAYWGQTWIVDAVMPSGRDTYTVECVGHDEYMNSLRLRAGADHRLDLQTELLELARRTNEAVSEFQRRRKCRHYQP
jgi:hypothetical protein